MESKRDKLLIEIRDEYLKRLEVEDFNEWNGSRKRKCVEIRGALMKSLHRFCSDTEIGDSWGKHRTTVLHSCRQHESYWRFSNIYRMYYSVSEQLVSKYSKKLLSTSPRRVGVGRMSMSVRSSNSLENELLRLRVEVDKRTDTIDRLNQEIHDIEKKIKILNAPEKEIEDFK